MNKNITQEMNVEQTCTELLVSFTSKKRKFTIVVLMIIISNN